MLRVRYRTAPVSTPYTIMVQIAHGTTTRNLYGYGIGIRDSAGKYVWFNWNDNTGSPQIATQKWSKAAAGATIANYLSTTGNDDLYYRNPSFMYITNDGTNLIFGYSVDNGQHLVQFDSRLKGDYLADQTSYGWGGYTNTGELHNALVSCTCP